MKEEREGSEIRMSEYILGSLRYKNFIISIKVLNILISNVASFILLSYLKTYHRKIKSLYKIIHL